MIEILRSPKHLVAFKFSGSMTAADVDAAYKATEAELAKHDRISVFAEFDDSFGFTVEGVIRDLVKGISSLGSLSRFFRAAVVTDSGWISTLARIEGLVFSSVQVRVFPSADRDKAFLWASEKPEPFPTPEEPLGSLHILATGSENVFAYEIDGKVRQKDIAAAVEALTPYLERDGKINVLSRLKNFHGFDLFSLFDDDLFKLKYKASSKVEKYAVVGAPSWLVNLVELTSGLFSTKIKFFDAADESAAWEWIGAHPALLGE